MRSLTAPCGVGPEETPRGVEAALPMAVVGPGRPLPLRDPHITAAERGRQHRRQVYASGAMRRVVRNSPAERLGENLEDLSLHLEELRVRPIRTVSRSIRRTFFSEGMVRCWKPG
jgi:hypothetical protein